MLKDCEVFKSNIPNSYFFGKEISCGGHGLKYPFLYGYFSFIV